MDSDFRLIAKINAAKQKEEYELRKLAELIEDELRIEAQLNDDLEASNVKMMESMRTLSILSEKSNQIKQSIKGQIKTLNEHQTVGNEAFMQRLTANKEQCDRYEEEYIANETKLENEWIAGAKSFERDYAELDAENKRLKQQTIEKEDKIKKQNAIFELLQKEIEHKRASIAKQKKECSELNASTKCELEQIEVCIKESEQLDEKINVKAAEIENEKINKLEICNKIAMLKEFEPNKESFNETVADIERLQAENKKYENDIETMRNQIEGMYEEMDGHLAKTYPLQSHININEPVLEQTKKKRELLAIKAQQNQKEVEKLEQIEQNESDEMEKVEKERLSLSKKINERQCELNQTQHKINKSIKKLVEMLSEIKKHRKWSNNLRRDQANLQTYINGKKEDSLLHFTKAELMRDFQIECDGDDIAIFGQVLKNLKRSYEDKQEDLKQIEREIEQIKNKELETKKKENEMKTKNDLLEKEISELMQKKKEISSNTKSDEEIKQLQESEDNLLKSIESIEMEINKEKEDHLKRLDEITKLKKKTLQQIDEFSEKQREQKKQMENKHDAQSKHFIDAVADLKMEYNREKAKGQHLKVELRRLHNE